MLQREYEKLIPDAAAKTLASKSYEVMEYVYGMLASRGTVDVLETADADAEGNGRVMYHSHCQ